MKVERLVIVTATAAPADFSALFSSVEPETAVRLAKAFLQDTLDAVLHPEVRAEVWLAQRESPLLDVVPPNVRQVTSPMAGDNTPRELLLERGFAEGYKSICFVGSNTPHLPTSFIQEALGRLTPSRVTGAGVDAVWGPTDDGTYCLVALRRAFPGLLSDPIMPQAESRLQVLGASYHLLPCWYQVSTVDELRRLTRDVRRGVVLAPQTTQVLSNLHV